MAHSPPPGTSTMTDSWPEATSAWEPDILAHPDAVVPSGQDRRPNACHRVVECPLTCCARSVRDMTPGSGRTANPGRRGNELLAEHGLA
jgi:hypothetical protein